MHYLPFMTAITLLLPRPQEEKGWLGGACASARAFVSMLCCTLNTPGTQIAAPLCTDQGAIVAKVLRRPEESGTGGRPRPSERLRRSAPKRGRSCAQGQKADILHSRDLGGSSSFLFLTLVNSKVLEPKPCVERWCTCRNKELQC